MNSILTVHSARNDRSFLHTIPVYKRDASCTVSDCIVPFNNQLHMYEKSHGKKSDYVIKKSSNMIMKILDRKSEINEIIKMSG